MSAPSKTTGTNNSYRRRAQQLRIRVAKLRNLHPDDVLPIHIVEHVLSHAAQPDLVFEAAKPRIGAGVSSGQSAANHRAKTEPGKDQSASTSGDGGVSPSSRRRIGSGADESPRSDTGRRAPYSRATFRQYKAALLADFEAKLADQSPNLTRADDEQLIHAINVLHQVNQAAFAKHGSATSASKAKTFRDKDLEAILTYLDSRVGLDQWAVPLQYWLRAGRLTGLRPGEWQHAAMSHIDGRPTLTVRNAKHSNGRGNGPERTLQLDRMIPVELNDIREMLEMVDDITGEMPFADLQHRVAKYLHSVTRQVLKPGRGRVATWPTLYSLRHQLLADAKRTLTQPEVAAIAGHASDATAGQHYGRRRSGVRAPAVTPSPGDVATVRRRAHTFTPTQGPGGPATRR